MRSLRLAAATALACAAPLVLTAAAGAEPGPIQLVSKSFSEQAEVASAPSISADGRYVAFVAVLDGQRGVFRKDLVTGSLESVATATTFALTSGPFDAGAPSISADGRYVAFTTRFPLDPDDDVVAASSDVYVADMATVPPSYELVSALDGCDPVATEPHQPCGLPYVGADREGARATGRTAISADGRRVAFYTTAPLETDLSGAPTAGWPAGQVLLRDLATDRTTLVSGARDPQTGLMETEAGADLPVPGGAVPPKANEPAGVSISGDGSTVAWLATNLPAQVPLLSDERATIEGLDERSEELYEEPLWRRVADGPEALTRRIVGGGDPSAPGCPADGTLSMPVCDGPFPNLDNNSPGIPGWVSTLELEVAPQLSFDGGTVALVGDPVEALEVYLVDMAPGLSRRQALRPLTRAAVLSVGRELGNREGFTAVAGKISGVAISADGSRVAFTTARQQFLLAPPNLIGSPPAQLGEQELYLIDLPRQTLERLTHGIGGSGEPSLPGNGQASINAGASTPSLSADGTVVAFGSNAGNLVAGDANANGDAFALDVPRAPAIAGRTAISAGPGERRPRGAWRLGLSARSLPDGRVRLVAVVPGGGALRARVGEAKDGKGRGKRLALARRRVRVPGPVSIVLRAPGRLRRRVGSAEGVYATARVSFSSPRRRRLHGEVQVRFRLHHTHAQGRGPR
jgi:Tol biopolymer transport system component